MAAPLSPEHMAVLRRCTTNTEALNEVLRIIDDLQQQERQFQAAQLHAVLESAYQAFTLIDTDYRVIDASGPVRRNAIDIFGKEMHPGDSIYDFVLERDLESFDANMERALNGETVTVEKTFSGQERAVYYFEVRYFPVTDSDGAIIGVCMSTEDITERKAAEEQLRLITDNMKDMVFQLDAEGRVIFASPSVQQLGRAPEAYLGHDITFFEDGLHPDDRERTLAAFHRRRQTGEGPPSITYRFRHTDGHYMCIESNAALVYDEHGNLTHEIIVARDISERTRAEHELRQREEQLRIITDHITDYIYFADWSPTEGPTTRWITGAFEQITGYDPADILAQPRQWQEHVIVDESFDYGELMRRIEAGEHLVMEYQARTAGGDLRWLRDYIRPVRDADSGTVTHLIGAVQDITARKHAERELRQSEEKYRLLLEHAGMGIGYYDLEGNVLLMNAQAGLHMQQDPQAMIGQHASEALGPTLGQMVMDRIAATLEAGEILEFEDDLQMPAGRLWFNTSYIIVRNGNRKPVGVQVISKNITDRKLAEQEVARQRAVLRQVIDASPTALFVKDSQARYVLVNAAFARFHNTTVEAVIGKHDGDLYPDTQEVRLYAASDQQVLTTGEPLLIREHTGRRHDGEVGYFQTIKVPLEMDGETHILGIATDITERVLAEQEAARQRAYLRQVIDALPSLLFVRDAEGRYVLINAALTEFLDLADEAIVGQRDRDLKLENAAKIESIEHTDRQVLERGEALVLEQHPLMNRRSGKPRHFQTVKVPLHMGPDEDPQVLGIAIDITERVVAEQEVARQRAFLRQIIDALPSLLFVRDADGRYVMANQAMADAYNTTTADIVGQRDRDFNPQRDEVTDFLTADQQVIRTLRPLTIAEEEVTRVRTGEKVIYQTTRLPLITADGVQVLTICTDITARRVAEQRALELSMEQERSRILARFIENALHEFRTPLSTIQFELSFWEMITDPDQQLKSINLIRRQSEIIHNLVEALATMTELDAGPHFAHEAIHINQLLEETLLPALPKIQEKGLTLRLEYGSGLPPISGDGRQLRKALGELIDNALRFTGGNGAIALRTRTEEDGVAILISDTGRGIAAEALPHIFDRFYREDTARTTSGFGLGLSIARCIIARHNGQITVQSTPGTGSIFKVWLPT